MKPNQHSDDPRITALAMHLACAAGAIEDPTWGASDDGRRRTTNGTHYLVLTDDEADRAHDEALDSYLDECVLPELPEVAQRYFDRDAWKADAKHDGRGHALASYDGDEHEVCIDVPTGHAQRWYIYRLD